MAAPNALTEIRDFLAAEGRAPEPWTSPEAALSRLHALLAERRSDDRFWGRLQELCVRLEDHRLNLAALDGFDAIGQDAMARLLGELRQGLRHRPASGQSLRGWFEPGAGLPAWLAFLLLGVSFSCAGSSEDWSCDDEAEDYGITGEDRDRLCALGDYVKQSDVDEADKMQVLECLPEMDVAYRQMLLESFQQCTAEQLNARLRSLSDAAPCNQDDSEGCASDEEQDENDH